MTAGLPSRLLNRPMTWKKAGASGEDPYGNPVPGGWVDTELFGYAEQFKTTESLKGQDTTTVEWKVWLAATWPVNELDRITIDGVTYEVTGQPEKIWNPRTAEFTHQILHLTGTKPGT